MNLRRSASASSPALAPPIVHDVLRSGGVPLDSAVRAEMEPRFRHSFADVRVHADARAAESARAVGAHAYAVGRNVVFGAGRYAPGSGDGKRLIAHELAHVVQQRGASASLRPKLEVGAADDPAEREADAAAERAVAGVAAGALRAGERTLRRQTPAPSPPTGVRAPRVREYEVARGDTLGEIAERFGVTVDALRAANGIEGDRIRVGQRLRIPLEVPVTGTRSTCGITVPSGADAQLLAGAIFAEAAATPTDNVEREAIGWSFVNSVAHTTGLCGGTICPSLSPRARTTQCRRDTTDLGATLADAVRIGSGAHGGPRWSQVMVGNALAPAATLCLLPPGDRAALERAILAGRDVAAGSAAAVGYVRFNRAASTPPSTRMTRAAHHHEHTFYRFTASGLCG
jgi:LysM repeat protein